MLKPRDIVVLTKVHFWSGSWSFSAVGEALGISKSQVHDALGRAEASGLWWSSRRLLIPSAFLEFTTHGLRYAFPTTPGDLTWGVPTGQSAPPMVEHLATNVHHVWPHPDGSTRGLAIEPLDRCALLAIDDDPATWQGLALFDCLRVGGARQRGLARDLLAKLVERRRALPSRGGDAPPWAGAAL